MPNLIESITMKQNKFIDQGAERYKYNKEMQNACVDQVCNSYIKHSSFYLGNTITLCALRTAQIALHTIISYSTEMTETLKNFLKNLPASHQIFNMVKELYDPFYKSAEPSIESTKVMGQKKLEVLTQSDATERNKTDQLQQTIQNAKDVYAQLLRSLLNH